MGRDDVIYVATNHPADGSVPTVAWKLDGATVAERAATAASSTSPTSNLTGTHTLTATVGDTHPHVDRRRHRRRRPTFTTSTPKATVSPAGRGDARVHLRGPVLAEAHRHRRQAGLRRARVPRRRRRLAELLRLADRRQRAVPVLQTPAPTSTCSTTASSPTAATSSSTGRSTPRATSPRRRSSRSPTWTRRRARSAPVGGTVPATLSLTLGATPPTFGAFTPGLAKDYTASMAADVISTRRRRRAERVRPARARASW